MEALVNEGFHVRNMEEYLINNAGERTGRVIKYPYFCSGEQIRLARHFMSRFIMETDAIFQNNKLDTPLSV